MTNNRKSRRASKSATKGVLLAALITGIFQMNSRSPRFTGIFPEVIILNAPGVPQTAEIQGFCMGYEKVMVLNKRKKS